MTTCFKTSEARHSYDELTDVLYVAFTDAGMTDGIDTERGFVVHYTWPEHALAGVTIMDFCERFGSDTSQVEIDADPPFVLVLDERQCLVTR